MKSDLSPAFRCSDGIAKWNFQIGEVVNLSLLGLLGALPGNQLATVEELETLTMGEMTAMTERLGIRVSNTAWQITFTTPTGGKSLGRGMGFSMSCL